MFGAFGDVAIVDVSTGARKAQRNDTALSRARKLFTGPFAESVLEVLGFGRGSGLTLDFGRGLDLYSHLNSSGSVEDGLEAAIDTCW